MGGPTWPREKQAVNAQYLRETNLVQCLFIKLYSIYNFGLLMRLVIIIPV